MSATYAIGIDLGTTNSVVAVTRLDQDDERPPIEVLSVPQLTGVSTVEPRQALPSFLYLGTEAEAEQSAVALPWGAPAYAVGEWARQQAADVLLTVKKAGLEKDGKTMTTAEEMLDLDMWDFIFFSHGWFLLL